MREDLVAWVELTTEHGDSMSDFYSKVLGERKAAFRMEDHDDYNLPAEQPAFGICHPASSQHALPPGWTVYLRVRDLERALETAGSLGAELVTPPQRTKGYGTHAVIRDPGGHVTALFEPENEPV